MKTKHRFLKWLAMLLLLIASTTGPWALGLTAAPTVNSLITTDTTPIITGTYDALPVSVTVNGVVYTEGPNLVLSLGTVWTLTIPSALPTGIYEVEASANSILDATTNELQIVNQETCPATKLYSVTPGNALNTKNWSVSPGATGVDWTISTPSASSTNIIWANPASTTVYTVTFRETDIATSCYTEKTITVKVNPTPSAPTVGAITQPTCSTATATVALSGLPTVPWTVTADNGGGTITGSTATADFTGLSASTTYTFTVTLTSSGCTSVASGNAVIDAQPPTPAAPTASATLQPTCSVSTGTITVTAPTGTGMTYSIDGSTYTNTDGIFTSVAAGTYSVTAKNSDGCVSSATSVTINAQPPTPATPSASNDGPICAGSTLTLSTATVSGATYAWTGPNSFSSSLQNPTITSATTAATGTYSVTVTVNGCTSSAGTTSATVNALPNPSEITY